MKISKTNLRQIIKEELGSLSEEENYGGRVPTYPELKRHPRKVAKPLSGTRVRRKSDGMTGYRTVGKKKDRAWSIKWNDGTYERHVPRSEFESIGDKD